MDDFYILRCMYLDLKDLLDSHEYIVSKGRKTPEIELLENRIREFETEISDSEINSCVRSIFDNTLHKPFPSATEFLLQVSKESKVA